MNVPCEDGPDVWFTPETVELAKRVCRTCPLRWVCFGLAMKLQDPHGVWGGFTAEERQQMIQPSPIGARP